MLSGFSVPSARSMANAVTVPSFFSPWRSVSLAEYRRVPAAFRARWLGLVPISWTPAARHRPGGAVHPEDVDAAAVARRQIHLGRQHVAERGAEGSDVGEQRPGAIVRLPLEQASRKGCTSRQCDRGFEKGASRRVVRIHDENGPAGWSARRTHPTGRVRPG